MSVTHTDLLRAIIADSDDGHIPAGEPGWYTVAEIMQSTGRSEKWVRTWLLNNDVDIAKQERIKSNGVAHYPAVYKLRESE